MRARTRRWHRELLPALIAVALVLVTRSSLADHYHVPSGSMEPTVFTGDRILVNKLAYGLRFPLTDAWVTERPDPQRGDVVVLTSPDDGTVLLKRVVGIGGDVVAVREGGLILNGAKVAVGLVEGQLIESLGESPHRVALSNGGGPDYGPTVIPDRHFLVMGDNRGNSRDGRQFGLVERKSIKGRAIGVYMRRGEPKWIPLREATKE